MSYSFLTRSEEKLIRREKMQTKMKYNLNMTRYSCTKLTWIELVDLRLLTIPWKGNEYEQLLFWIGKKTNLKNIEIINVISMKSF